MRCTAASAHGYRSGIHAPHDYEGSLYSGLSSLKLFAIVWFRIRSGREFAMHRFTWVSRALVALSICFTTNYSSPALADKRVALVIGISAYKNAKPLANPVNDAKLMAETLSGLGFTLSGGGAQVDLDKRGIDRAVQSFAGQLRGADVGLFYFAGHGIQVRGSNYLIPVDADLTSEADIDFQLLDVTLVLRQMGLSNTRLNLVLLDACRNNPFGGRGLRNSAAGLAEMRAPEGTLISFATQPGNVAADGTSGNSPYTQALAQSIKRPGLGIFDAVNEVGLVVKRISRGGQQPWFSTSPIDGQFYFAPPPQIRVAAPNPTIASPPCEMAGDHWRSVEAMKTPEGYEDHLVRFPNCAFAGLARERLSSMKGLVASTSQQGAGALSLEARARHFLEEYMRESEAPPDRYLAFVGRVFGNDVAYYGKRATRQAVLDDQRKHVARWPNRTYKIRPDVQIRCIDAELTCGVSGDLDYVNANPATRTVTSGVWHYDFRVVLSGTTATIVEETGHTVSKQERKSK